MMATQPMAIQTRIGPFRVEAAPSTKAARPVPAKMVNSGTAMYLIGGSLQRRSRHTFKRFLRKSASAANRDLTADHSGMTGPHRMLPNRLVIVVGGRPDS